jgi:biotin synthase
MTGEIISWLRENDPGRLETLWRLADEARRVHVGDHVHLRGLLEISNHCVRQCGYCGLRRGNKDLVRYRMTEEEIVRGARAARDYGYGTVVLQSGEDYGLSQRFVARLIRRIKAETGLAITLSLGERPLEDLAAWREAGANRYLLRFETSDPVLYALIHPGRGGKRASPWDRVSMLQRLRALGYEIGSGVMVGIPGQTYETLAHDIELFQFLDLDMIGVGPYIAHPKTPLGDGTVAPKVAPADQVPSDELMAHKVVALARLVCPEANIPSTTALATINRESGRELGLQRGANVVMPNVTPPEYRVMYEIYPGKACVNETAEMCRGCLAARIRSIGRTVGRGPGDRSHGAQPPRGYNNQGLRQNVLTSEAEIG